MSNDLSNIKELKPDKKGLFNSVAIRERSINLMSALKQLPDPDPILKKLGKDITAYRDLLSDAHVWACVQSRKAGVKKLKWSINRNNAKENVHKLIEQVLNSLDVNKIITEMLDAPLFGMAPMEIMWQKIDNNLVPVDVIGKPPEWFTFGPDNSLRFKSKDNRAGEELPPYKFLCPTYNASYNNPFGERTLSRCFWYAALKKGGLKWWATLTEKYGMDWIIGKIPREADKKETEALADKLESLVQDAIAIIPEGSDVQVVTTNKTAGANIYKLLIEESNAEMSKALVGQTLTTEVTGNGSYAASKTHNDVREDIVDDDKNTVESNMNLFIKWICLVNFGIQTDYPLYEMWAEEEIDKTLAERDDIVFKWGFKPTKEYLMKAYGYEEDDIEIIEVSGTQQSTKIPSSEFEESNGAARKPSEGAKPQGSPAEVTPHSQQVLDDLLDNISAEELQAQIEPILQPVRRLIANSNNYEEIQNALAEQYPEMDDTQFEATLAKTIYLSELWGRLTANAND